MEIEFVVWIALALFAGWAGMQSNSARTSGGRFAWGAVVVLIILAWVARRNMN